MVLASNPLLGTFRILESAIIRLFIRLCIRIQIFLAFSTDPIYKTFGNGIQIYNSSELKKEDVRNLPNPDKPEPKILPLCARNRS